MGPFFSTSPKVIFFKGLFMYQGICYVCNMETTQRLGIGNVTDHRLWRMVNIVLICFSLFYRLTWGQRCWPRSEFGSVSVISSFILQDIPRHDTRIYFRGSREASKRTLLLGVRASISAYIAQNALRRLLGSPQQTPVYYIINALVTTRECCLERANIVTVSYTHLTLPTKA